MTPLVPAPVERIAAAVRTLVAPDQVVELIALGVTRARGRPVTACGFYTADQIDRLAAHAAEVSPHATGVYLTLNPLQPALLARRGGRLDYADRGNAASDADVTARRWVLVDADPVRPAKIGATAAEKGAAHAVTVAVRDHLRSRGWPDPVFADSGNGYHLLYRVDLPADDGGRVKRLLAALADRFDTPAVKLDRAVHNPARLVKVPGTLARKGDHTPDRPHRVGGLIDRPESVGVVTTEQIDALLPPVTAARTPPTSNGPAPRSGSPRLDVARWLTDRGVPYRVKDQPDARGRTVYVLAACPFDPAHADPDACVMQAPSGQLAAHCFHNACEGRGWQAFKAALGPPADDHFDPPRTRGHLGRGRPVPPPPPDDPETGGPPDADGPDDDPERPTVAIEPADVPVDRTARCLTAVLVAAGDCYRRAGQLVRVAGDRLHPVLTPPELAGLVSRYAEVTVAARYGPEYRPLPTNYAQVWLNRPDLIDELPPITLFTRSPVYTRDWRLAPPGYDPASGIYSAGPAVAPRDGTEHLDRLLDGFCFRTPADRTRYLALLVTAALMPRFVGAKPLALFTANQPGLGKTVLAQILAILRDGRPAPTASYNPNDEEFEKRLGAMVRDGLSTLIIDNAKGRGRAPVIESGILERCVTDAELSFRLLGQSAQIRAENMHQFCLTANAPRVSPDLVTRSLVIALHFEGDPRKRAFALPDPEGLAQTHRVEILSEVLGLVERWRAAGEPLADVPSRFNKAGWGPVVGGVLAANGWPDLSDDVREVDLDEVRVRFADLMGVLVLEEKGVWTAAELAALAARHRLLVPDLGDGGERARSIRLGLLAARFVGERFDLPGGGGHAVFDRRPDRKGVVYTVTVHLDTAA